MDEFLTPKQVATMLQLTEQTLANQRSEGRGLPFIKIERAVRYRRVDIEHYFQSQTVNLINTQASVETENGNHDGI